MAEEGAKKSDFVKTYVWGMGLIALVLAAAWWKVSGDRDEFRDANARATVVFGDSRSIAAAAAATDGRTPTTITGLALGIHKYLVTAKEAKIKPEDLGKGIPLQQIRDMAVGAGLSLKSTPQEQTNPVRAKGYEEVFADFQFEPTDLDRLSKFLYDYETRNRPRVLDLRWDKRAEKENPLVPGVSFGNLIQGPRVKIGFRRPIRR